MGYILPYKMRIFWAFLAIATVAATESYLAAFIAPLVNQGFAAPEAAPQLGEAGHWYASVVALKEKMNHLIWGTEHKLWAVPLFLVFLMTLRGLGRFVSDYLLSWVGVEAMRGLRRDMFAKMLRLSSQTQQDESSGNLSGRFLVQAGIAISNASSVFITVCRDSLIVAGLVAVLLYLNWQLQPGGGDDVPRRCCGSRPTTANASKSRKSARRPPYRSSPPSSTSCTRGTASSKCSAATKTPSTASPP